MIEFKITNPHVGSFTWEPSPKLQARLMELEPDVLEELKVILCSHIEKLLLNISGLTYTSGNIFVANSLDLQETLREYSARCIQRVHAAKAAEGF